jgi:hypothetical protein
MVANIIKVMFPWDVILYSTGIIISDETVLSIIRAEISSILTTEGAAASSQPLAYVLCSIMLLNTQILLCKNCLGCLKEII